MDTETKQRLFAKIPLITGIAAGVFVLGGLSYFGVRQYAVNQTQNIEKEKLAQEIQRLQLENQMATQKNDADSEIQKLQQQNSDLLAQISTIVSSTAKTQTVKKPAIVASVAPKITASKTCDKLKSEYTLFEQQLPDALNQASQINSEFSDRLSAPSILTGADLFGYLYTSLSGAKDTHFKKIDKLESSIGALSLTTFGLDQPQIFQQIFQKWIDYHSNLFNSFIMSFKLAADNPLSVQAVTAAQMAYDGSINDYKGKFSEFSDSYQAALANFEKVYKDAYPKLGCQWVTPGTISAPEVHFSSLPNPDIQENKSITIPINYGQTLYWTSNHAETCKGSVDAVHFDKDWTGDKAFSGSQTILPTKPGIVNYILQCTNSYGTTQSTITINVTQ